VRGEWEGEGRGKYSSIAGLESAHLLLCAGELLLRDDALEHVACDVPELLVLALEQKDDSRALRVER
jgi:hypothetical protein